MAVEYRCATHGIVALRDNDQDDVPRECPRCGGRVGKRVSGYPATAKSFSISVTANDRGPVVLLGGELDISAAPDLRDCLHRLIGDHVTLDFSDVTCLDSTAISVLVAARNRAQIAEGRLVLTGVQPAQMRVFKVIGLTEILDLNPEQRWASAFEYDDAS